MNYPNDIFTLIRQKTFSIEGHFHTDFEESPMKIFHDSFSKFKFNIVADKEAVSFNLHIEDLPGIVAKTRIASDTHFVPKQAAVTSGHNSPAFTVRFRTGNLKGKTPVDVLLEDPEKGKEMLNGQYKWLKENLEKYPANKEIMDAIIDATKQDLSALSSDAVSSSGSTVMTIVDIGCRPLTRKTRDDGKCFCYEGKVTWDTAKKYPVCVSIKNYYAPVTKKDDGTLNVNISGKDKNTEKVKDFNMTAEEWLAAVQMMESTRDAFMFCNFNKAYAIASEAGRVNRESATSKSA